MKYSSIRKKRKIYGHYRMPAEEVLFNLRFSFLFELILKILMILYISCRRNTFKFILLYPSNKFKLIFPVCILFHFVSCHFLFLLHFSFLRIHPSAVWNFCSSHSGLLVQCGAGLYSTVCKWILLFPFPFTICQTCHSGWRSYFVRHGPDMRVSNGSLLL